MNHTLAQTTDQPFAPAWLVMPLAAAALLLLTWHVTMLVRAAIPASRRRIRIANGVLMMVTTPMAAYALGIATPNDSRRFAFAWVAVTGLVVVVIFLAVLDILNTWRLSAHERRGLPEDVLVRLSGSASLSESDSANRSSHE